ncbi:ATP-binding protein [Gimesia fumaroli]|uniref:ATP-binding protein n=1 Tax=Gimesia fumaroli TaxID=2527976 RepID=A0A518I5V2_9PLAN|nr:ATP-binding protein [Gimesia fumaroli]QDV48453.1 hypothetical protein Enr17x_04650 [Gimesia fumaroli]
MALVNRVHIARRFQKSIRIDTDLGENHSLEGFICPQSSADVLRSMAKHVSESGQGAFTWTGPYGSGKSSLVVALSALLNGNPELQKQAAKIFGRKLANEIQKSLPTGSRGWHVLPVVGRRDNPVRVIGEALKVTGLVSRRPRGGWTEDNLISNVMSVVTNKPKTHGGLILFVDEMGKFLEAAAQDGTDMYVFQQLAEAASRSDGRLILIGVLHQAFEEYAHRLSHETRDEWAKIQGRFIDLPVNSVGEEQIDIISRAIESERPSNAKPSKLSMTVARLALRDRQSNIDSLANTLENCWPLHPIVACLLGPISRRRFGQNQRSIFGFLNSTEPHGFQDYLISATEGDLYGPDKLWDYLRTNLEPSILASPDGHRWALAADSLERCEAIGGDIFHVKLLKTISVIDLFKERSGLVPSFDLLRSCFPKESDKSLKQGLAQLDKWSLTIFKKFQDAHAIFAGSDFDIDHAVGNALEDISEIDFTALKSLAGLQPILAKRHYHETGAMRWFDVNIAPARDVVEIASSFNPKNGIVGEFLLVIPTEGENEELVKKLCREASKQSSQWDIVVGFSQRSWAVVTLARELLALDKVYNDHPELAGDPVARREVSARLADFQAQLESELNKSFDKATWYRKHHSPKPYRQSDLSSLASELADKYFDQCPRLYNELLNRQKPSGSAIAAQNALLRCMVNSEGESRLGINGYPAEGGLFASLLESTRLYSKTRKGWSFLAPQNDETDTHKIFPAWEAAINYIKKHKKRAVSVSEICEAVWLQPPYGIKEGVMPVLSVAFIMSQRENLAIYREGIFRARFDDVDVECLAKDAGTIQLRWMDLNKISRRLLSDMAQIVRELDQNNELKDLEPIDVARGLVSIYEQLPQWTKRTMRLSANAIKVRDIFNRAHDPNKFLFDDIPTLLNSKKTNSANTKDIQKLVSVVSDGLQELVQAYPSMLHRLRDVMLAELQVPNLSRRSLSELRDRATNIKDITGDFRLDAFIGRVAEYDGSDLSFEGIASLAANKPPRDWVDPDTDHATMEVADMSQQFLRAETFTRVKGRPEKRQTMAIIVGLEGRPAPLLEEFDVIDSDRETINDLIKRVSKTLETVDTNSRNVILATLAELSARYMQKPNQPMTRRNNGEAVH